MIPPSHEAYIERSLEAVIDTSCLFVEALWTRLFGRQRDWELTASVLPSLAPAEPCERCHCTVLLDEDGYCSECSHINKRRPVPQTSGESRGTGQEGL